LHDFISTLYDLLFFLIHYGCALNPRSFTITTRITGTAHTSAKARLTNVAIQIRICIQIRDPDRHQNTIICLLAYCQPSLQILCKSVSKFLRNVADRQTQTNRQTNNDDYISSLAEVIRRFTISTRHTASTSMYSLTFCVRVMSPERHHWKPAVQAAAVMLRTPPSPTGH